MFSSEESDGIANKAFPECFLRGFNVSECFTAELNVAPAAFQFGDHSDRREDNCHEASINWEDDRDALNILMEQKKDGTEDVMFKFGYARLPLNLVRMTLKSLIDRKCLAFERKPLQKNPYHGNILIPDQLKRPEKLIIQNSLAAIANNDAHPINI